MSLTLGEKLRQAREERGISISEVAEQTRISSLYLQSIENDDYKPLPGGIFNKGFVKSYAKFIGIDEQEALDDYAKLTADWESRNPSDVRTYRPEVLTDDRSGGSLIPTIIFAGIILALMTGGVLFVVNYLRNQPATPAVNTVANTANTDRIGGTETPAQPATPSFDEIKVEFKATREKISVTANIDGAQRTQEVGAGETAEFTAKENMKLSYYRGFAEMVEFKLNGKAITPPAPPARGNAVTVDLNKQNVAEIWQAGDFSPTGGQPANTNTAAATTAPASAATPAVRAAPARTAPPVGTPAPSPTRRTVIVGSSPAPRSTPE
jgi:cytoskeleton protein RodZ